MNLNEFEKAIFQFLLDKHFCVMLSFDELGFDELALSLNDWVRVFVSCKADVIEVDLNRIPEDVTGQSREIVWRYAVADPDSLNKLGQFLTELPDRLKRRDADGRWFERP